MTFQNLVFAGGGSRCLWQAGFYSVIADAGLVAPREIACVSAGSAIAAMVFSDTMAQGLRLFQRLTRDNRRNLYPENLLRRAPLFPHPQMYRRAIESTIDAAALARLKLGPRIRVAVARMPAYLPLTGGIVLGLAAYELEKRVTGRLHPSWNRQLGFACDYLEMTHCDSPQQLADLILASSATPPITPVITLNKRPALDGGLVDNVPVEAISDPSAPTLVLLSRRYRRLPQLAQRLYVQPSRPIPIAKWDYTNPEGLQQAFDLGRLDGDAFVRSKGNR